MQLFACVAPLSEAPEHTCMYTYRVNGMLYVNCGNFVRQQLPAVTTWLLPAHLVRQVEV